MKSRDISNEIIAARDAIRLSRMARWNCIDRLSTLLKDEHIADVFLDYLDKDENEESEEVSDPTPDDGDVVISVHANNYEVKVIGSEFLALHDTFDDASNTADNLKKEGKSLWLEDDHGGLTNLSA